MRVALGLEVSALGRVQQDVEVVVHARRIRVIALVGLDVASGIAGVGIAGREGDLAGRREAEDARVAAAAAAFALLEAHQHARHGPVLRHVEEHAHVVRAAVLVARVQEAGVFSDGHAVPQHRAELGGRLARVVIFIEHPRRDQVVPVDAGKVEVGNTALDGLFRALEMRERGQDHVVGDLRLHPPQAELQRDVPVEGKAVRHQAQPVLLLLEAQHAGRHDQVGRHERRVHHAPGQREGVEGAAVRAPQGRGGQLHQQRHADQHRDEGQVYDDAERRELSQLIDFEREAGVERDAAQGGLGVHDDAGRQDDHRHQHADPAGAGVHPGPELAPHHVGAGGAHQDGEVDEDHRAQRVQHVAARIEHRREHQHTAARKTAPEIQARQQEQHAQRHAGEAARRALGRQEQQEGQQDGGDGDPQQRARIPPGGGQRLQQDLELRPSLHGDDRAAADGQRPDHEVPLQAEAAVLHLQAGQHPDVAVPEPFGQVPVRPEVMESQRVRDLQQRRFRRNARIRDERHIHAPVDVVVGDGELMAPGLQRVAAIAVDYEVLRQVLQLHPVGRILRERLGGVRVQLRGTALQHALHAPRLAARVARRTGVVQRSDEERRPGHKRDHGEPFPAMSSPSHS